MKSLAHPSHKRTHAVLVLFLSEGVFYLFNWWRSPADVKEIWKKWFNISRSQSIITDNQSKAAASDVHNIYKYHMHPKVFSSVFELHDHWWYGATGETHFLRWPISPHRINSACKFCADDVLTIWRATSFSTLLYIRQHLIILPSPSDLLPSSWYSPANYSNIYYRLCRSKISSFPCR